MNAKTQEKFVIVVGSNDGRVSTGDIMEAMCKVEEAFNTLHPNMRMHCFKMDIQGEVEKAVKE